MACLFIYSLTDFSFVFPAILGVFFTSNCSEVIWPSGLRRCFQVAFFIGAGSNPAITNKFLTVVETATLCVLLLIVNFGCLANKNVCSLLR